MDRVTRRFRGLNSTGGALLCGLVLGSILLVGCGGETSRTNQEQETTEADAEPVALGPLDGFDLPPTDLQRVTVGSPAPDFTLLSLDGDTVTLSSFQGSKDVILVFYRGHW